MPGPAALPVRHPPVTPDHVPAPLRAYPLLSAVMIAVCTLPAGAQTGFAVQPGETIRVSTSPHGGDPAWKFGVLSGITDMYLLLQPVGAGLLAIPHDNLTRVERSVGWGTATRTGAVFGTVAGIAAYVVLEAVRSCSAVCLVAIPAGAAGGVVLGAGVGGTRWHDIDPGRLRPRRLAGHGPRFVMSFVAVAF